MRKRSLTLVWAVLAVLAASGVSATALRRSLAHSMDGRADVMLAHKFDPNIMKPFNPCDPNPTPDPDVSQIAKALGIAEIEEAASLLFRSGAHAQAMDDPVVGATPLVNSADISTGSKPCCNKYLCPYEGGVCCADDQSCCPATFKCSAPNPFVPTFCKYDQEANTGWKEATKLQDNGAAETPKVTRKVRYYAVPQRCECRSGSLKCTCTPDPTISLLEMEDALMQQGPSSSVDLMKVFDLNNDGKFSWQEYSQGLKSLNPAYMEMTEDDLIAVKSMFDKTDTDHDGFLSVQDLLTALNNAKAAAKMTVPPTITPVKTTTTTSSSTATTVTKVASTVPGESPKLNVNTTPLLDPKPALPADLNDPSGIQAGSTGETDAGKTIITIHINKLGGLLSQKPKAKPAPPSSADALAAAEAKRIKEYQLQLQIENIVAQKLKIPYCFYETKAGILRLQLDDDKCNATAPSILSGTETLGNAIVDRYLTDLDKADLFNITEKSFRPLFTIYGFPTKQPMTAPIAVCTANRWRLNFTLGSTTCPDGWNNKFNFYAYPTYFPGTIPYCIRVSKSNLTSPRLYIDAGEMICDSETYRKVGLFYAFPGPEKTRFEYDGSSTPPPKPAAPAPAPTAPAPAVPVKAPAPAPVAAKPAGLAPAPAPVPAPAAAAVKPAAPAPAPVPVPAPAPASNVVPIRK